MATQNDSGTGQTGSSIQQQQPTSAPGADRSKMAPGDEAAPGTPGTGEDVCRCCGGSGKMEGGKTCEECGGTGKVTVGIGGA